MTFAAGIGSPIRCGIDIVKVIHASDRLALTNEIESAILLLHFGLCSGKVF